MISLISFLDLKYLPRQEAVTLDLLYKERPYGHKIGINNYDEFVIKTEAYYHYSTDLFMNSEGKYCSDESLTNLVENYCIIKPLSEEELKKDYVILEEKHLVDLTKFAPKCKYPFSILQSSKETLTSNIQEVLMELGDKTTKLERVISGFSFNEKCNVHIGGGLIVTFNDLKLCEDACMNNLQKELNNGWRIIACCVQPDQRRPDYILGRYNPEKDSCETIAKRG